MYVKNTNKNLSKQKSKKINSLLVTFRYFLSNEFFIFIVKWTDYFRWLFKSISRSFDPFLKFVPCYSNSN
jgi:hypothetical protein